MVKFYPSIPDDIQEWMLKQSVWFTASAPLAGKHINVSPKGHPESTLAVLNQNQIAYLDATGSGCETISHIYENGRVTIMFCSFGAAPRILRLFCRGRVVEKADKDFNAWVERMIDSGMKMDKAMKGIRAVIVLDVFKVQTSCGFGVPVFPKSKTWDDRPTMPAWSTKMAAKNGLEKYRENNNWRSLDGCPGLKSARRDRGQWLVVEHARARTSRVVMGQWDALIFGFLIALLMFAVGWKLGLLELKL
ncbi:pyridoxamine phosphate oxidase [Rhizodiscina lignyota]|uniref:Pyridoxamine phosphate oxidase n=1 Tax=Rhizodiscina lignyota TaxID=1504668 RepID=A0A9P4I6A3_9PEZI|nr:pyridoxamine phosphate oxidase [Rhizodiscina lignyota]